MRLGLIIARAPVKGSVGGWLQSNPYKLSLWLLSQWWMRQCETKSLCTGITNCTAIEARSRVFFATTLMPSTYHLLRELWLRGNVLLSGMVSLPRNKPRPRNTMETAHPSTGTASEAFWKTKTEVYADIASFSWHITAFPTPLPGRLGDRDLPMFIFAAADDGANMDLTCYTSKVSVCFIPHRIDLCTVCISFVGSCACGNYWAYISCRGVGSVELNVEIVEKDRWITLYYFLG